MCSSASECVELFINVRHTWTHSTIANAHVSSLNGLMTEENFAGELYYAIAEI